MRKYRLPVLIAFAFFAAAAVYGCFNLKFSFDFSQFFPRGDDDLAFFLEFVEEFEGDDNFLLVALERKDGVFDSTFLDDAHDFALKARDLKYIEGVQSLTTFAYPLKTPFAVTTIPRHPPRRSEPLRPGQLADYAGRAVPQYPHQRERYSRSLFYSRPKA